MNDGIKLTTQTSFMEKGTVQCKKSRLKEIITSSKVVVSKPFKNNDALIHSLSLALPSLR